MKYYFIEDQDIPVETNDIPDGYVEATREQLLRAFPQSEGGAWPRGVYDSNNSLIAPVPYRYMTQEEKSVVDRLRSQAAGN